MQVFKSKAERQFAVGDQVTTLTYDMIREKYPEFKANESAIYGDEGCCYVKLMDEYYGETYVVHSINFGDVRLKCIDGRDVPCNWAYFTIEHDGRSHEIFNDTDLNGLFDL